MFNLFKDRNNVTVTKENWNKIESLFALKEKTISEQQTLIDKQRIALAEMTLKCEGLMKYKENDDLLFAYENQVKEDAKKIKALNSRVKELENTLVSAEKKVSAVLALESAYLQKIIHSESQLRRSNNPCPDYEAKDDRVLELVDLYA